MQHIAVVLPRRGARNWHLRLIERLVVAGHRVGVVRGVEESGLRPLDALLGLESRHCGASLAARVDDPEATAEIVDPTLVIDLSGAPQRNAAPVLTLACAGTAPLAGAAAVLLRGGLPELTALVDGTPVATARPMVGERVWLSRGLDDVLARAITLLVQQAGARRVSAPPRQISLAPPPPLAVGAAGHALALPPRLALRALGKRLYRPFHWRVGYRFIDGPGVAETGSLAGTPWSALPDDGERFFADPFPFEHAGRLYLFVEEYPHATARGVISVMAFDDAGRPGPSQVVLEAPHHLSYPQVFARDGAIWMLPESSAAHDLVLYRADPFPHRWVRHSVLVTGSELSDATLLDHGGRLWLFAAGRDGLGSPSDTLLVYGAPSLEGPWVPHQGNPIRIDRAAARPGGAFVARGGEVLLPLQDGSLAYGGGLGLARLEALDEAAVRIAAPVPVVGAPRWPHGGIHTLNRAGRLEAVDGFVREPRRRRR